MTCALVTGVQTFALPISFGRKISSSDGRPCRAAGPRISGSRARNGKDGGRDACLSRTKGGVRGRRTVRRTGGGHPTSGRAFGRPGELYRGNDSSDRDRKSVV